MYIISYVGEYFMVHYVWTLENSVYKRALYPVSIIREPGYEVIDKVKLYAMDYDNIRIY